MMINKFYHLVILTCFLLLVSMSAYTQTKIIKPATYSYFQAAQRLPDSTYRVFNLSNDTKYTQWDEAVMIDFPAVTAEPDIRIIRDSLFDWTPFYSAEKIVLFPLGDGSSILGINQFDCDYPPPSEISMLNPNGFIIWRKDFYWGPQMGELKDIGLIANDTMVILFENGNRYFNFQGDEVSIQGEPAIYTNVLRSGQFYVGSHESGLVLLNEQFEQIDLHFDFDTIHLLMELGDGDIISATRNEVCLFAPGLNQVACNNDLKNIISTARTTNNIWVANHGGVYKLDTLLKILDYFPVGSSETVEYIFAFGDTIEVLTNYNGINHADLVKRTFNNGNIILSNSEDIGIGGFRFPEVIKEIYIPFCSYGGLHFDFVEVMVRNYSDDTIRQFTINLDWRGGGMCSSIQKTWEVDTVDILPFDSLWIHIDTFRTECANLYGGVCFWVADPNGLPDRFPQNDLRCEEANIVTKTLNPGAVSLPQIFPNPADDKLTVSIPTLPAHSERREIQLFNFNGILLEAFQFSGQTFDLPISSYPNGIYFLRIIDHNQQISSHRFVIQK